MFTETRKMCKRSQDTVANECVIDRKRYIKIEKEKVLPDPNELVAIDKFLQQDGKLIKNYCSGHCPAGKVIGLRFEEMPPLLAGVQVMKFLRDAEGTRPELESILADGVIDEYEQERFSAICEKYYNLANAITSLVMHKKTTCVGAQMALRA